MTVDRTHQEDAFATPLQNFKKRAEMNDWRTLQGHSTTPLLDCRSALSASHQAAFEDFRARLRGVPRTSVRTLAVRARRWDSP